MEIKLSDKELTKLFNYLNQQPYQFSAPIIKMMYDIINEQKEELPEIELPKTTGKPKVKQ